MIPSDHQRIALDLSEITARISGMPRPGHFEFGRVRHIDLIEGRIVRSRLIAVIDRPIRRHPPLGKWEQPNANSQNREDTGITHPSCHPGGHGPPNYNRLSLSLVAIRPNALILKLLKR